MITAASVRHSETLPSTVIAISEVVPPITRSSYMYLDFSSGCVGEGAGGADYFAHALMSSRSHPGEAGNQASRANQTNESTCTDLTSSQVTTNTTLWTTTN